MFCFLCHFVRSGNSLWRGYRVWVLEGMAEERPGAGARGSRLPATEGFRGPWGSPDCKLVLQQQKRLLKPCGFFSWVVRNCVWIPLLRSSLVWSPGETREALQLCQHSAQVFVGTAPALAALAQTGVSPP